jgi:hypothetical protein
MEKEKSTMSSQDTNQNAKKKEIFGKLFKGDNKENCNSGCCCNEKTSSKDQLAKESTKGGCCNIKIVPKEKTAENKGTK